MDERFREKFSGSKLTGKNVLASIGVLSLLLMAVGGGLAASSGTKTVGIGQNGVHIYSGSLNVDGNDIQDAGTTIWDASAGQIATAVVDYSAATATDVGLGNVRNIDIANTAGNFLSYDSGMDMFNVDGASIQSGTTASDVGLGNVQNEPQVAEGGDAMTGLLEMYEDIRFLQGKEVVFWDSSSNVEGSVGPFSSTKNQLFVESEGSSLNLGAGGDGNADCYIGSAGDLTCSGTKDWVHNLNSTHEAIYTSQESGEVRAVYEGQTTVTDGMVNVSLPYHFSGTVSDERPSLRVQATPHSLANVAVTERTDDYLVIKADTQDNVKVDYRVTGIREGYEDKQVVRPK